MDSLNLSAWVALSGAVFAGLSAAAALGAIFLQYRLLPKPLWIDASRAHKWMEGERPVINWNIEIVNRGNASAHDVYFVMLNHREPEKLLRHMEFQDYGNGLSHYVQLDTTDEDGNKLNLPNPRVDVLWRQAPNMKKVRRKRIVMPDV